MSPSTSTFDPESFLRDLSFDAAELTQARAGVRHSETSRVLVSAAARKAAGTGVKETLGRATALYLLGHLREARAVAADAGESTQARLLRGRIALEDADPAGAAEALASLTGSAVDGPELQVDLATALALTGDAEGAHKAAGRVGSDRKADALYAEGVSLEAAGKRTEARAKYQAAIAADATHARSLFRLAHAHDLAGEDEAAMDLYRRCTELDPAPVNALLNLGILFEDHDRFPEAEALYRRVLDADPAHERARLFLKDVQAAQTMYFDEDIERKEDRRNQVLRTPISEFELSVRSRNCLAKMEIKTLGDLITKTEQELLAYKNFGETSLQEIKDILAQKGLHLGMGRDEAFPAATREEAEAELDALFGRRDEDEEEDEEAEEDVAEAVAGEPPSADPRARPVDELDLSTRARQAVESLEIQTIGDLAGRTEAELASAKVGATTIAEIRKKLAGLGLSLAGGV